MTLKKFESKDDKEVETFSEMLRKNEEPGHDWLWKLFIAIVLLAALISLVIEING